MPDTTVSALSSRFGSSFFFLGSGVLVGVFVGVADTATGFFGGRDLFRFSAGCADCFGAGWAEEAASDWYKVSKVCSVYVYIYIQTRFLFNYTYIFYIYSIYILYILSKYIVHSVEQSKLH